MSLFITVDALDGVGKSTLVQRLALALGGLHLATPGDQLAGVRRDVLRGLDQGPDPAVVFYAATCMARGAEARRWADQGTAVVMDRYWLSTIAYGLARRCRSDLEGLSAFLPRPDVELVLHLDETERRRRLVARGDMTKADAETLDAGFAHAIVQRMTLGPALAPTRRLVDLTGADRSEAVRRALAAVTGGAPGSPNPLR